MYQRKQASYKGYVLYNFIYMALWTHEIHKQRGQSRGSSEQGAGKSSWQQRGMRNLWRQWNCVDNDGYIWFWDHASSESYNIELMLYHKLHQKKKKISGSCLEFDWLDSKQILIISYFVYFEKTFVYIYFPVIVYNGNVTIFTSFTFEDEVRQSVWIASYSALYGLTFSQVKPMTLC